MNKDLLENMFTAEVYKSDKRVKSGKRLVGKFDYEKMSMDEVLEKLKNDWNPKKGFTYTVHNTYVIRKNIMSSKEFIERYDVPSFCSPSSESYWSM